MLRSVLVANRNNVFRILLAKRSMSSSQTTFDKTSQVTAAQDKSIEEDILYKEDHVRMRESLRKVRKCDTRGSKFTDENTQKLTNYTKLYKVQLCSQTDHLYRQRCSYTLCVSAPPRARVCVCV